MHVTLFSCVSLYFYSNIISLYLCQIDLSIDKKTHNFEFSPFIWFNWDFILDKGTSSPLNHPLALSLSWIKIVLVNFTKYDSCWFEHFMMNWSCFAFVTTSLFPRTRKENVENNAEILLAGHIHTHTHMVMLPLHVSFIFVLTLPTMRQPCPTGPASWKHKATS